MPSLNSDSSYEKQKNAPLLIFKRVQKSAKKASRPWRKRWRPDHPYRPPLPYTHPMVYGLFDCKEKCPPFSGHCVATQRHRDPQRKGGNHDHLRIPRTLKIWKSDTYRTRAGNSTKHQLNRPAASDPNITILFEISSIFSLDFER